MRATIDVKVDLGGLKNKLEKEYGVGSKTQEYWTMSIFDWSAYRVPYDTGKFLEDSRKATQEAAADGEIIYTGEPTPYEQGKGITDFASALWNGMNYKLRPDGGFELAPIEFTNPNASERWTMMAWDAHGEEWIAYLQEYIWNK